MIKSYGKINLSLKVLKKLKNKLHDIETHSILIDLCDLIKIKKIDKKKDTILFKGKFKKFINNSKNSITSTLDVLRTNNVINKNDYYKIIVDKKIPVFSGLGGGTSNAFFLIKYFKKKIINMNYLNRFLGSDLNLFFYKQLFQKKLNKVFKLKKYYNLYFVLVYPNIKCSTKVIYSKVKKFNKSSNFQYNKTLSKLDFIQKIKKEGNDLESIVIKKFHIIKKVINFISLQPGCYFSRMTGSGSVCFGMFKNQRLANSGLKSIKKKFPKYWCVVTKTI